MSWYEDTRVWLDQNAKGKSFADIGGMWGSYWGAFEAVDAGADPVLMLDLTPPTPECIKAQGDRDVTHLTGDLHNPAILEKVGLRDIVLCSGVIYHCPNPLHTLECLREITKDYLILTNSASLVESDIPNDCVFLPCLTVGERRALVSCHPDVVPAGVLPLYKPRALYENWYWAFTPSALASMLVTAGFKIVEHTSFTGLESFIAT